MNRSEQETGIIRIRRSVSTAPFAAWLVLAASFFANGLATIVFASLETTALLESAELAQFFLAAGLGFGLSIAAFFVPGRTAFRVIGILRAFLALVATVQLPVPESIPVLLTLPVVLELAIYSPFPRNLWSSVVYAGIVSLSAYPPALWSTAFDPRLFGLASMRGVCLGALAVSASLVLRYRETAYESQEMNSRLDGAIGQLIQANIGFQDYAAEIEGKSKMSERMRVSRDLHDIIGGTLTNVLMMMEAAQDHLRGDRLDQVRTIIQTARSQAEYGLEHTRHSLYALRGDSEREAITGLHGVRKLVGLFEAVTDVTVRLEAGNVAWSQDPEVDDLLYHVIQEGMTNAFRHGKATEILIVLFQGEDYLSVCIRDNGQGSAAIKEGIGLSGMRERLDPLGGTLSAGPIGVGFELRVTVPTDTQRLRTIEFREEA